MLFILIGPSGAGKTSLGRYLESVGIPELTSHTTRPIGSGEVNGKDYYFVSVEEFKKIEFLETDSYAGNLYGLSKEVFDNTMNLNSHAFIVATREGRDQIVSYFPFSKTIFITAKLEALMQRLESRKRGENIMDRIQNAIERGELSPPENTDFIIENEDLDTSGRAIQEYVKGFCYG